MTKLGLIARMCWSLPLPFAWTGAWIAGGRLFVCQALAASQPLAIKLPEYEIVARAMVVLACLGWASGKPPSAVLLRQWVQQGVLPKEQAIRAVLTHVEKTFHVVSFLFKDALTQEERDCPVDSIGAVASKRELVHKVVSAQLPAVLRGTDFVKFLVANKARNAKLLLQSCDFMLTAHRLGHVLKKEVAADRRSEAQEAAAAVAKLEAAARGSTDIDLLCKLSEARKARQKAETFAKACEDVAAADPWFEERQQLGMEDGRVVLKALTNIPMQGWTRTQDRALVIGVATHGWGRYDPFCSIFGAHS